MTARERDRMRWAAFALALAGLALAAQGAWIPAKAWLAQRLLARAWAASDGGARIVRPWPWADTWPIAKLDAEGRNTPLYVLAGASGEALAFGPGHVSASASPGSDDRIVLAGHRDTHFAFLRSLASGDAIWLEAGGRRRRYVARERAVVHESRTDLLAPTGRAELVLITCWPFDAIAPGGPMRLVVIAEGRPPGRDA